MGDDLREYADDKKVAAYQHHRDGGLENRPRRINIDFAEPAAEITYPEQCATNEQADRLDFTQGVVITRENQCLAPRVDSGSKNHRQPENQKFATPVHN